MRCLACVPLFAGLAAGCISSVPRKPDVARPDPELGVVDFAAIFADGPVSQSVYANLGPDGKVRHRVQQILLSPNLVFESSRSSLNEPLTLGPVGADATAPNLDDALGKPVSIALSSTLLNYLVSKGSTLITPSITSLWQSSWGTWLERSMPTQTEEVSPPLASSPAPMVALAVRELGIAFVETPVIAESGSDRRIRFRPRRSFAEKSLCGAISLSVPVVHFAAELVSTEDGRLIARVLERRHPPVDVSQEATIDLAVWKPIEREGYTMRRGKEPLASSRYSYVRKWRKKDSRCEESLRAYREVRDSVVKAMELHLAESVKAMLQESLDPLFAGTSAQQP